VAVSQPQGRIEKLDQGWREFIPEALKNREQAHPIRMQIRGVPNPLMIRMGQILKTYENTGDIEAFDPGSIEMVLRKCCRDVEHYHYQRSNDHKVRSIKTGADFSEYGHLALTAEVFFEIMKATGVTEEERGNSEGPSDGSPSVSSGRPEEATEPLVPGATSTASTPDDPAPERSASSGETSATARP